MLAQSFRLAYLTKLDSCKTGGAALMGAAFLCPTEREVVGAAAVEEAAAFAALGRANPAPR